MITKTWPYGTVRKAIIKDVRKIRSKQGDFYYALVLTDQEDEGHVILCEESTAKPGDQVTLTFTEGGPTGGHWRISP